MWNMLKKLRELSKLKQENKILTDTIQRYHQQVILLQNTVVELQQDIKQKDEIMEHISFQVLGGFVQEWEEGGVHFDGLGEA